MRAFCINAGIGVLLLFALQLTFMAAVLSLTDQALKGNPSKCGAFLIQARDRIEGPMAEPAMESSRVTEPPVCGGAEAVPADRSGEAEAGVGNANWHGCGEPAFEGAWDCSDAWDCSGGGCGCC